MTSYHGSCHCGAVRYTVDADLTKPVLSCDCSMCGRTGTLLTFVGPGQFQLEQGADVLTDYRFNKHNVHHLFCKTCGVKSFARGTGPDGSEMVAINARCLEGLDLTKLEVQHVQGSKF